MRVDFVSVDAAGIPQAEHRGPVDKDTLIYVQVMTALVTVYMSRDKAEVLRSEGLRLDSTLTVNAFRWTGDLYFRGSAAGYLDLQIMGRS